MSDYTDQVGATIGDLDPVDPFGHIQFGQWSGRRPQDQVFYTPFPFPENEEWCWQKATGVKLLLALVLFWAER